MTIDKKEFDKSIDKSKSLCDYVKELLQKNKEVAYSYGDIKNEFLSTNKNYPNNIKGSIDLIIDSIDSVLLTFLLYSCLLDLENKGLIQSKLINNETYYIWIDLNIKVIKK